MREGGVSARAVSDRVVSAARAPSYRLWLSSVVRLRTTASLGESVGLAQGLLVGKGVEAGWVEGAVGGLLTVRFLTV